MLKPAATYDDLITRFRWVIPERYNIATSCCDNWAMATPDRPAIIEVSPSGAVETLTYGAMQEQANRLANVLASRGIVAGDRVAIMLPQGRYVPIAHFATYKSAAIALPMANVFGPDAIGFRLTDSGAKALITNAAGVAKIRTIASQGLLPASLQIIFSIDGADGTVLDMPALMASASSEWTTADTSADTPALMIFTSGTTGQPKGALHAHRTLLGHLPGMQMPHEFLPQEGDRLWTPADWAWIGGLINILLTGLHLGVAVVGRKTEKFDPEDAIQLMAAQSVRNTFFPPTALRMLRSVQGIGTRHKLDLRTLASGGETLGEETFAWGREALGLRINEFYGQTECNLIISSAASIGVSRPGSMGRPVPGHEVRVIREDATPCEIGEIGAIAVRSPDPVMFLKYWNKPEATKAKFNGEWLLTGDQGHVDVDGYYHFTGRDDDVITSAGYRIGPGEIEDCLIQHEAVLLAAVVGKPDALRTEIVKAFLVLKPGYEESEALKADIQSLVRTRLSAHEYPREIAFIGEMPLTTTGKIIRRLLRDQA